MARSETARTGEPPYDCSWATHDYFVDLILGDALDELGPETRRSRLIALSLFLRAALSLELEDDWIRAWMIHYDSHLLGGVRRLEDGLITGVSLRLYFTMLQGAPPGTWVGRGHGWGPALSRTMNELIANRAPTPVDLHFLDLLEPVAHLLGFDASEPSETCSMAIDIPSSLALLAGVVREWPRADLRRKGKDELTRAFLTCLGNATGKPVPARALVGPLDVKDRTVYAVAKFLMAVDGGALIERRSRGYVLTERGVREFSALKNGRRRRFRAD